MEKRLKILMLEDLEDDAGLVKWELSKNKFVFDFKRVDTKEAFVKALETDHPDVVLSDHALPQFNSIEALKICRGLGVNIPFILVTGTVSEEFAVSCLKRGADDYILKTNLTRLVPAIQHALKQRELQKKKAFAEAELRSQNEILHKVNQELDSFVYSISHNLRAPLLSLLGLLNLIKKEDEERENYFKEYLGMMHGSIMKLDATLKEILDYSRNARNQLEFQIIDLNMLIQESFTSFQYLKGFDEMKKEFTIQKTNPLRSDKYRLMFIFNNLISNAIKYRDNDKVNCWLRIETHIDHESATFIFEDNGVGIHEKYQNKVFDMFYRASELSDGAGLGLYIVKEAVNRLNGNIVLKSKVGEGTRFIIRLPNS